MLLDRSFDSPARLHVSIRDLEWQLHDWAIKQLACQAPIQDAGHAPCFGEATTSKQAVPAQNGTQMTRVERLMNQPAIVCSARDSVMVPAALMLEHDCGVIPVVDLNDELSGIITDRDVCMAAYTEAMSLRHIAVSDVMQREVVRCSPRDTIRSATRLMEQARVRRLPVVDEDNHVVGVLSLADLVRESAHRLVVRGALSPRDVVSTLAQASRSRRSVPVIEPMLESSELADPSR
jgi:CBS domain-containing protein